MKLLNVISLTVSVILIIDRVLFPISNLLGIGIVIIILCEKKLKRELKGGRK